MSNASPASVSDSGERLAAYLAPQIVAEDLPELSPLLAARPLLAGWGHRIHSYALNNSRIKDPRTNVEISATQKVLDGDLDQLIEASLKQGV